MVKIIGYGFMILGILIIVLKLFLDEVLKKITFIPAINLTWIIIIGVILIVLGFLASKPKFGRQGDEEVPIYDGKKIVGYRRK